MCVRVCCVYNVCVCCVRNVRVRVCVYVCMHMHVCINYYLHPPLQER